MLNIKIDRPGKCKARVTLYGEANEIVNDDIVVESPHKKAIAGRYPVYMRVPGKKGMTVYNSKWR